MTNNPPKPQAHVFGPVPSRRLGRSLGVDIIPYKLCSLDCIYCQVGRTTECTTQRQKILRHEDVAAEIADKLTSVPRPDYVTLSGSGEPTLYADLGPLIADIKRITDVPVAVLTNGTLLYDPIVRAACADADLVIPSLDAGDEAMFQQINRPAPGLSLEQTVTGMAAFRKEYAGQIWLEVFLIDGLNDSIAHAQKIAALAARIAPDRVQLNTAVRPTAEADVCPVTEARLHELCKLFGPTAEVIADFRHIHDAPEFKAQAEDVLEMIRRRPVTLDDIAAGIGAHRNAISKHIEELLTQGRIRKERRGEKDFFRAV